MPVLKDLRQYVRKLDALGDIRVVDRSVDGEFEAAAIIRRCCEIDAPAPLFTSIAGTQPGFRLLGAPASLCSDPRRPLARVAISLGLGADATAREIVGLLAETCRRDPVPPRIVPTGECKQNVLLGDDARLTKFPTPMLHEGDGGPYVNTWGTIVATTPDGKFTNWSISRVMMIDDRHLTGLVNHPSHLAQVWQQWADRGEPMPFAIVQGGPPALPFVAGMPLPDGVEESGYLGALLGEPVDVVRCETVDLLVPATAEIVIEGHLSVERSAVEGPMGEFAGFRSSRTSMQPVYTIEAITHRDDPIWPVVVEGEPVDEYHTVNSSVLSALVLNAFRDADLPVTTVWQPLHGACHVMVVSVPQDWREQLPGVSSLELAQRMADVVDAHVFTMLIPRLVVLDDDVDSSDSREVMWAMCTRIHPTGRRVVRQGPVLPLLAMYTAEERAEMRGPKVVHDALLPPAGAGRDARSSFHHAYPPDVRERVLRLWGQ